MHSLRLQLQKRIPGILYLVLALTAFYTLFVMNRFEAAEVFSSSEWFEQVEEGQLFFSSGILSFVLMNLAWILTAYSLYVLYRKKERILSELLLLSVILGGGIVFIVAILQSAPLFLMTFQSEIAESDLPYWIERCYFLYITGRKANAITSLFYSIWLYPLALLLFRDQSINKPIRVILLILLNLAGTGYLADFVLFYLYPLYDKIHVTDFTFFGEVAALFWMLGTGLNIEEKGFTGEDRS